MENLTPLLHLPESTLPYQVETEARDKILQTLLGIDYNYARESGLIDIFSYDPENGRDGIMHILAGEEYIDHETGQAMHVGFHHEPSADLVAKKYKDYEGHKRTYVDRRHLTPIRSKVETAEAQVQKGEITRDEFYANTKAERDRLERYRELPFEVYPARVVIDGLPQYIIKGQPEGPEITKSSVMFPKEYDPLTVLKVIKRAYDNQDRTKEKISPYGNIEAIGLAPMIDYDPSSQTGHQMKIKLILDPQTRKIIDAYPQRPEKNKKIQLTKEDVRTHLERTIKG